MKTLEKNYEINQSYIRDKQALLKYFHYEKRNKTHELNQFRKLGKEL